MPPSWRNSREARGVRGGSREIVEGQVRAMAGPTLCRDLQAIVRTSHLLSEGTEQGRQDLSSVLMVSLGLRVV